MEPVLPLLKTPDLVLREIFKNLGPNELFSLCLCSRRTKFSVHRNYKRFNGDSLRVAIDPLIERPGNCMKAEFMKPAVEGQTSRNCVVRIRKISELPAGPFEIKEINNHRVPIILRNGEYETFWKKKKIGLKNVIEDFYNLFRVNVETLFFTKGGEWILDWVNRRQITSAESVVIGESEVDFTCEEIRHFMPIETKNLFLRNKFPTDFILHLYPTNYDCLGIEHGNWLSLMDILHLFETCKEIEIQHSKLTSRHVNYFLKRFIKDGLCQLEMLRLANIYCDKEVILNGLQDKIVFVQDESMRPRGNIRPDFHYIPGVYIKRDDGLTAKIMIPSSTNMTLVVFPTSVNFFKDTFGIAEDNR